MRTDAVFGLKTIEFAEWKGSGWSGGGREEKKQIKFKKEKDKEKKK